MRQLRRALFILLLIRWWVGNFCGSFCRSSLRVSSVRIGEGVKSIGSQKSWAGVLPPAPRALTSKPRVSLEAVKGRFKGKFCSRENFLLPGDLPNYLNVVY